MFGNHFELNKETLSILEAMGSHMPGGFFIYKSASDGELLYANKAVLDIFGCADLDEFRALTGFTFRGMLHPEDYETIHPSILAQIGAGSENLDYMEYRIVRKDGAVRWVDDYGHFTETEAYGGICYVFISDITEKRERMESDLAVRQAVIEALSESYHTVWLINDVETGTFSLYRGDTEGVTAHAGPIRDALGMMRYPEAKEFYIRTTVAASDQARLQEELTLESIAARLSVKPRFSINYLRVMDDGSERYFRIEFAKVNMPGGKMGVVCGFKDVDDEVREEQAVQKALQDARKGTTIGSLGYVLIEKARQTGDFEEAIAFNTEALEYDDEDPVFLDNMGQLCYAMGDRDKALEYFKKAHEFKPKQVDTLYYLAKIAWEDGDGEKALQYLDSALEGNYSALCTTTREMAQELYASLQG